MYCLCTHSLIQHMLFFWLPGESKCMCCIFLETVFIRVLSSLCRSQLFCRFVTSLTVMGRSIKTDQDHHTQTHTLFFFNSHPNDDDTVFYLHTLCVILPCFFPCCVPINKEQRQLKRKLIINLIERDQKGYKNKASPDLIDNYAPY